MNRWRALEAQEAALAATGCNKLFSEQASSVAQRDQLTAALDFVRQGDTLVVSRLDRLARSTADLLGIVALLERKQVALRILDFARTEADTRSPTGRVLLAMFAAVAEFERAIMLERQRVGVARARAEGQIQGPCADRPPPGQAGGGAPCRGPGGDRDSGGDWDQPGDGLPRAGERRSAASGERRRFSRVTLELNVDIVENG